MCLWVCVCVYMEIRLSLEGENNSSMYHARSIFCLPSSLPFPSMLALLFPSSLPLYPTFSFHFLFCSHSSLSFPAFTSSFCLTSSFLYFFCLHTHASSYPSSLIPFSSILPSPSDIPFCPLYFTELHLPCITQPASH